MARIKRSVNAKKKRRKVLERASGYKGARSRRYRTANEQVMHAMQDAYRDRRARKGDFRRLWITRINAAARQHGTTYSRFIAGLKAADVAVDRKMLAELAVSDPAAFGALVATADEALPAPSTVQPAPPQPAHEPEPNGAVQAEGRTEKAVEPPPDAGRVSLTALEGMDDDAAAAAVAAHFGASAPGDPDDLKGLKGVGPVMEGRLNDLGIRTLAQIAAMSDDDIAVVSAVLSGFKDEWVAQAKELESAG